MPCRIRGHGSAPRPAAGRRERVRRRWCPHLEERQESANGRTVSLGKESFTFFFFPVFMPGDIYFGITEDGKCLELGNNDKVILKPGSILELTKLLPCELGN